MDEQKQAFYDVNPEEALSEGLIFDKQEELAGYIRRLPEFDYMSTSLATSITAQLGNGIVVKAFPFWKRKIPVTFDFKENKIFVNSKLIQVIWTFLQSINPLRDEKKRFKAVIKDTNIGLLIGGICYHGIHSYNIKNRGALINTNLIRRFYREYLNRAIYDFTKLTTLSNKISDMMYAPYLNTIKDYYEVRSYTGAAFNASQGKALNYMFSSFDNKVKTELVNWGFDYPTINEFEKWYRGFMIDLNTSFINKNVVVINLNDEFMHTQEAKGKGYNVLTLAPLYNTYRSVGGPRSDVEGDRFPTAPFKELYSTAEPMAQLINSFAKQNKLKEVDELQSIASKGISYLR